MNMAHWLWRRAWATAGIALALLIAGPGYAQSAASSPIGSASASAPAMRLPAAEEPLEGSFGRALVAVVLLAAAGAALVAGLRKRGGWPPRTGKVSRMKSVAHLRWRADPRRRASDAVGADEWDRSMKAAWHLLLGVALACTCAMAVAGDTTPFTDLPAQIHKQIGTDKDLAPALRIVMMLTMLSIIPTVLIATTAFLRIVIVLVLLRHAIGLQDAPPNMALMIVALFMSLFAMLPTLNEIDRTAWQPYVEEKVTLPTAMQQGVKPLRDFMLRQTREQDLALVIEISKGPRPATVDEVGLLQLVPAFMLSELRMAFQIGFVIFLPFLVVDLVVASVLGSLGMMMVPPVLISLPLKILLFVLIDGWKLFLRALIGSFH